MDDELIQYFKVKENCWKDILAARETFTDPDASIAAWHAAWKGLGLMQLHCPEDIRYIVEANRAELQRRAELLDIWIDVMMVEIPGSQNFHADL